MRTTWIGVGLTVLVASCGADKDPSPTGPTGATPTRITLIAPHPTLAVGASQQLSVVLTGPDGVGHAPEGPIAWRSSNESVYAVWPGGIAVAVAPGQATVTASADGRSADTVLRVDGQTGALRHVQGRLTDFTTQAAVSGITIGFGRSFPTVEVQATTDGSGAYTVELPPGEMTATIDGQFVGSLAVRVGGPAYRGDLLGNGGTCVSRYGAVSDAVTFQPVAGATVRLGGQTSVTGVDGWYRIDLGCDINPINNFGTTLIYVSHPAYREFSRVVGRGVHFVNRLDAELQRP